MSTQNNKKWTETSGTAHTQQSTHRLPSHGASPKRRSDQIPAPALHGTAVEFR